MINFNEVKYKEVVNGALNKREKIEEFADIISDKGYTNIFFIGCGGTYPHSLCLK